MAVNKIEPKRHEWGDIYIISNKIYVAIDDILEWANRIETENEAEEWVKHDFITTLQSRYSKSIVKKHYNQQIEEYMDLIKRGYPSEDK